MEVTQRFLKYVSFDTTSSETSDTVPTTAHQRVLGRYLADELAELGKNFGYEYWERVDKTHSGVRFCASWATTQEHVDALRAAVQALRK